MHASFTVFAIVSRDSTWGPLANQPNLWLIATSWLPNLLPIGLLIAWAWKVCACVCSCLLERVRVCAYVCDVSASRGATPRNTANLCQIGLSWVALRFACACLRVCEV